MTISAENKRRFAAAEKAAREAGGILMDFFGKSFVTKKKGRIDLVTEADLAAETAIVQSLAAAFPDDNFLSEESHRLPDHFLDGWIIDPLDGTTNFTHGYPFFSVSIGYRSGGQEILGVVNAPAFGELFRAIRGGGASMNGQPAVCSKAATLRDSMLVTGFAYDLSHREGWVFDRFRRILLAAQAVRRDGSAALDLCYVACGRFDGYWEENLKPWDTAAGRVIAEEAGARVSDFSGHAFDVFGKEVLATNGLIHDSLISFFGPPRSDSGAGQPACVGKLT